MNNSLYLRDSEPPQFRFILFFISALLCLSHSTASAEQAAAALSQEEAWMGQGVDLYVTLEASGPFDGTASFDLPEIPKTFILKEGRPVVGSRSENGQTFITQRHTFRIFSQRQGLITIPSFTVRYSAKPDYAAPPETHTGVTKILTFNSKQPPGFNDSEIIIAARDLEIRESWAGLGAPSFQPGDVVTRTLVQTASNTSGLLFPAPSTAAPEGVRVYAAEPVIEDKTERGRTISSRTDVIRYQFTTGGTVQLPELQFSWWNPTIEKKAGRVLQGIEVEVMQAAAAEASTNRNRMTFLPIIFQTGLLLWALLSISRWYKRPDKRMMREIRQACRKGDARTAYQLVLNWTVRHEISTSTLGVPWTDLSRNLYAVDSSDWNGEKLIKALKCARAKPVIKTATAHLAPLNPP